MRNRPSLTAAWVAAARSFGVLLPADAHIADDPYGARFAHTTALFRTPRLARAIFPRSEILYMQVRTRVLDDALLAFLRAGGAQLVLLGAGFDCRALRFARELNAANATVFEVDHPATQAKKREVLRADHGAHTEYVAWNFEQPSTMGAAPPNPRERLSPLRSAPRSSMRDLPAALAARGHDASKITLTLWEGVTMYLSDEAIDTSVAAMRDYSAPGSRIAFTYIDRNLIDHPTLRESAAKIVVARAGEPFRFGWKPEELPNWLVSRGFEIVRDQTMRGWGHEVLPAGYDLATAADRHIAIASRI